MNEYTLPNKQELVRRAQVKYDKYLQKKHAEVLSEIDPICKAFGLDDVEYIIDPDNGTQTLRIGSTKIGCTGNSVSATVDELIAYIFVNRYCKNRDLGAFHRQTINHIKRYWISE